MKKNKLFLTSTLVLFTFIACNKRDVNLSSKNQNPDTHNNVEEVTQKMYNLSPEQIKSSISFLTETDNPNQSSSKNFIPGSDLALDSSIWVLEAALNYHFDKDPEDHDVYVDSVEFSAPLNLTTDVILISPSDFADVYNQFMAAITQKSAGPQKVKVIDITATMDYTNGRIIYKADIVFYVGTAIPNCIPFPTGSFAKFSSGFFTGYGCIPPNSATDGPTEVTKRLNNCQRFILACGKNYYWVNVNTRLFYKAACFGPPGTVTQPSHFLPMSATNLCTSGLLYAYYTSTNLSGSACNVFSGNTVNSQVSAFKAVALSNIPSTPAGVTVANQNCSPWFETFVNSSSEWGWCNVVTYGYPVCNPVNPN